mmetsp:Transcript_88639/g.259077  ORF Transcript_88639/g.259077 Transcript_88639/m.259077 type:complete len:250 (-) Transcript_88639:84-833(-)
MDKAVAGSQTQSAPSSSSELLLAVWLLPLLPSLEEDMPKLARRSSSSTSLGPPFDTLALPPVAMARAGDGCTVAGGGFPRRPDDNSSLCDGRSSSSSASDSSELPEEDGRLPAGAVTARGRSTPGEAGEAALDAGEPPGGSSPSVPEELLLGDVAGAAPAAVPAESRCSTSLPAACSESPGAETSSSAPWPPRLEGELAASEAAASAGGGARAASANGGITGRSTCGGVAGRSSSGGAAGRTSGSGGGR